jgi:hypothetical protein
VIELRHVKGRNILISFWTNDENMLLEIRKILMRNSIKHEWYEAEKMGFVKEEKRGK